MLKGCILSLISVCILLMASGCDNSTGYNTSIQNSFTADTITSYSSSIVSTTTTSESNLIRTEVTDGEIWEQVTNVYEGVEIAEIYNRTVGNKNLVIEITTTEEYLLDDTKKYIRTINDIIDICSDLFIKQNVTQLSFMHNLPNYEENMMPTYALYDFNLFDNKYVASTAENERHWDLYSEMFPDYFEALEIAINNI